MLAGAVGNGLLLSSRTRGFDSPSATRRFSVTVAPKIPFAACCPALKFMMKSYAAYLAGIIDGEGTITITRHRQYQRPHWVCKTFLWVSNTNPRLIRTLKKRHDGAIGCTTRAEKNHKDALYWRVMAHERIYSILDSCLPYLIIKRRQAEIMLKFIESRRARYRLQYSKRELQMQARIRKMNERGRK